MGRRIVLLPCGRSPDGRTTQGRSAATVVELIALTDTLDQVTVGITVTVTVMVMVLILLEFLNWAMTIA